MKKIIILCICIILIIGVGAAILWKYMAPPKTITEICRVKLDDIDRIVLQDGDDGREAEITDKNEIANILGKINVNKYSYLDSKKYNGFSLRIKLYSSDKLISDIVFPTDQVITISQRRYEKASGEGFDVDELADTYIK